MSESDSDETKRHMPRFFAEFVVIVVSILAAFGLDAWWDGRVELGETRAQQETLSAEFSATRNDLVTLRETLESLRAQVAALLPHISPDAALLPIDSLNTMIDLTFRLGTVELGMGSVEALLASGGLAAIPDNDLKALLASWPAEVARLRRQSGLLEQNREQIIDYLHDRVPTLDITHKTGQMSRYPASSFRSGSAVLQRDMRLEGLFANRGMMVEDTDNIADRLLGVSDRILSLLTRSLDGS